MNSASAPDALPIENMAIGQLIASVKPREVVSFSIPLRRIGPLAGGENTMGQVCAELGTELIEFDGEADHMRCSSPTHPLWRSPHRSSDSRATPPTPCTANTPKPVCPPLGHLWSPSHFAGCYGGAPLHTAEPNNVSRLLRPLSCIEYLCRCRVPHGPIAPGQISRPNGAIDTSPALISITAAGLE
ncbi:transposase [Mycobacterium marinum E11]|nr:transposase [Mycobacterium marinum E11]